METQEKSTSLMSKYIDDSELTHKLDDIVEGPVIAIDRSCVYIDLAPVSTGVIYGREFLVAKDILRKIKIGDVISAKIIDTHNENGYVDLSLKEARQAAIWSEAEQSLKSGRNYTVIPKSANRGGLIIEWSGIVGFLPASQLNEEHYPKVMNNDKEAVLSALKKLIGERLTVHIITASQQEEKLIFSEEKNAKKDTPVGESATTYEVGNVCSGVVTGVVDFGVFVKIDQNAEGLVHLSELDWGLVSDPRKLYAQGDNIKVKIIDITDGKYSFSAKAVKPNPWETAEGKYKVNDVVSGVVVTYNTHGAFVSIEAGVTGLVHISNYESVEELRNELEIGKPYDFVINTFKPQEQKLTLTQVKDKA